MILYSWQQPVHVRAATGGLACLNDEHYPADFTSADVGRHLDGFIRRSIRQGYCASDLDFAGIIDQADEKLFQLVVYQCKPCSILTASW